MLVLDAEKRLEIKKGIWMNYKSMGFGDPMLCIHGWNDNSDSWKAQIEYFSATHTVFAIDLMGHGKSSFSKDTTEVSLNSITSDILLFMEKIGLSGVELLCHSIGCLIGLNLAGTHPHLVKKINLINPISVVTLKFLNTLENKMLRGVPLHRCRWFPYFTQKFSWKEINVSRMDESMTVNVIRGAEDISEAKDYLLFLNSIFPNLNFFEIGEKFQKGKIVKAKHSILTSHASEINNVISKRQINKKVAALSFI